MDQALEAIPAKWRLMSLSEDSQRGFYCCLRTREPTTKDYWPAAVSYGNSYVEAIEGAIKAIKEVR